MLTPSDSRTSLNLFPTLWIENPLRMCKFHYVSHNWDTWGLQNLINQQAPITAPHNPYLFQIWTWRAKQEILLLNQKTSTFKINSTMQITTLSCSWRNVRIRNRAKIVDPQVLRMRNKWYSTRKITSHFIRITKRSNYVGLSERTKMQRVLLNLKLRELVDAVHQVRVRRNNVLYSELPLSNLSIF